MPFPAIAMEKNPPCPHSPGGSSHQGGQRMQPLFGHITLNSPVFSLQLSHDKSYLLSCSAEQHRLSWWQRDLGQVSLESAWAVAGCSRSVTRSRTEPSLPLSQTQTLLPIKCPSGKPLCFSKRKGSWITFFDKIDESAFHMRPMEVMSCNLWAGRYLSFLITGRLFLY